jgi:hypothetical protein
MNPDPKHCWQALEFSRRNSVEINCRMNNVVYAGWDIIARTTGSTGQYVYWQAVESGGRYSIEALPELHAGRHWDPAARSMPGQLPQESEVECMPAAVESGGMCSIKALPELHAGRLWDPACRNNYRRSLR